jgi:hypothetical protein
MILLILVLVNCDLNKVSQKTKMAIYSSIYIPTLLYGSEYWVITEKQKQNIQTAEIKYLRRVIGKKKETKYEMK